MDQSEKRAKFQYYGDTTMIKNNNIGLSDLISKVKKDLLIPQPSNEPVLFTVDEIVLEVKFTISGDIESGFDLGVVTLGSKVNEERVQKVTIKLTPVVSKEQIIQTINLDQEKSTTAVKEAAMALIRGVEESTRGLIINNI